MDVRALPIRSHTRKAARDFGWWLWFFGILYIILLIKVVSLPSLRDSGFFGIYSILITLYIISRFLFSYFHRSVPVDTAYVPSVSFVVPAKNEEENIAETIRRFDQVNYPKDKIEVIAINDGSTDNTIGEMRRIAKEIGQHLPIEIVHWEENRGKRAGMAEGVRRARNDIVIFIDSDSFVDKECVRHLVKYFKDPRIGGVSGHTDVFNRATNMLTKMQAVRYYIAFSVYKAAESVFGSVTCCPGCCSAYRRSYLNEFIEEWAEQKFLGVQCTFGDDRSLTNFVIRKYKAVYSFEAKAHTVVPENFKKYLRQQQRWKKSWVRETFIASTFMWRKNPLAALSFYAYMILAFSSPIVFFRAIVWHPYQTGDWPVIYLVGLFLMLVLHGVYYRIKVRDKFWFLAIVSFWFNTVILMWQLPWAMITISDSRWGTR